MNCVIYARVSTEKQADKELSIPAQLQAMREYAKKNDWQIVGEFIEPGASARSSERPVLQEMLSRCRHAAPKVDVVLVHKIDRLARNVFDHATIRAFLQQKQIKLASVVENVDDSVTGQLVENIMASIAQFYSANLGEEVRKGMRQKVEQGGWPHQVTRGYQIVRDELTGRTHPEIDPLVGPVIREAFELYAGQVHSLRGVSEFLAARGVFTCKGNPIPLSYVRQMLENPFYVGRLRWREAVYQGSHTALISEELFQRVSETLRRRYKDAGERGRMRFLMRGVASCAACGRRMTAERHRKWSYYRCIGNTRGRKNCDAPYSNVQAANDSLGALYKRLSMPDSFREQLRTEATSAVQQRVASARKRQASLRARRARVLEREMKLTEGFAAGHVPAEIYKPLAAKCRAEVAAIDSELATAGIEAKDEIERVDRVLDMAGSLWELHQTLSPVEQQRLLRKVFTDIMLQEGAIVGYTLRPPFDQLLRGDGSDSLEVGGTAPGPLSTHLERPSVKRTIQSILEFDPEPLAVRRSSDATRGQAAA